jgi:hypothetical protein
MQPGSGKTQKLESRSIETTQTGLGPWSLILENEEGRFALWGSLRDSAEVHAWLYQATYFMEIKPSLGLYFKQPFCKSQLN